MPSPFPGMDPYIEASHLWEPFHFGLISEIERALAELLPPRYVVRAGKRAYVGYLAPPEHHVGRRSVQPDVSVLAMDSATAPRGDASVAVATVAPGVRMHGIVPAEHREAFLEILDLERDCKLVTGIEALSPGNKRWRSGGWRQYERKRTAFFLGRAHFVEVDLLRRGRRRPMQESWPASPYYVLVMKQQEAPACTVLEAWCSQPLPTIPIPLLPPDKDCPLALQPLVDNVYRRGRYELTINYTAALRPRLATEDAAWWSALHPG